MSPLSKVLTNVVILHCMFDIIYHFLKIMLSPIEIHIVITEVGGRTGTCADLMSG